MLGTVLDTGATKVKKMRCLLARNSHHLVGGQDRPSQFTIIIAMTEVATRTNSLKAEIVSGQVQETHCISSASCYCVVGYDGSTCLLEQQAQPHMRSSSFSSMRTIGYVSQLHNSRVKGMGLGRPLGLAGRTFPTRKTLHLWVLST